jgi:histidinol-phosphate aminotransferase
VVRKRHGDKRVAVDLKHHGDKEVGPGLIDLAVNVRTAPMPPWLAGPIHDSLRDLARYPDDTEARQAIAQRHARTPGEVLLTAGAAQAFSLIAHGLRAARPLVVHPQFTEPEAVLLGAGMAPERLLLDPPFTVDGQSIPTEVDLVVVGNPTNPTSVLHPVETIEALARPGRVLVVDEAFADTIPGEVASVAHRRDIPGLLVVRSLTKTWGLAGLRIGYVLGEPALIDVLARVAPLWPVSAPALAAAIACSSPVATAEADRIARELSGERAELVRLLRGVKGVTVAGEPRSSFVLIHLADAGRVRERLRDLGWAVRRGDTFPGLGRDWLRIAVRDAATSRAFARALAQAASAEQEAGHAVVDPIEALNQLQSIRLGLPPEIESVGDAIDGVE